MVRDSLASRIISWYFQKGDCIRKISSILRETEGQYFLSENFLMDRKHCFVLRIGLQSHYSTAIIHKEKTEINGLNIYKCIKENRSLIAKI